MSKLEPSYSQEVSKVLADLSERSEFSTVFYGENIDSGSKLGGLGAALKRTDKISVLNVPNTELSHCGFGFGLALAQKHAFLIMKQLDFLLLGLDQLCNTQFLVKSFFENDELGTFGILAFVCDQGMQGPQSSLHRGSSISNLTGIDTYYLNTSCEIIECLSTHFNNPGFRLFLLSQKSASAPLNVMPRAVASSSNCGVFTYRFDKDSIVTVVCFGFAIQTFHTIVAGLRQLGVRYDLFHINQVDHQDFESIMCSSQRTSKVLCLDDTSDSNNGLDQLIAKIRTEQSRDVSLLTVAPFKIECSWGVKARENKFNLDQIMRFIDDE